MATNSDFRRMMFANPQDDVEETANNMWEKYQAIRSIQKSWAKDCLLISTFVTLMLLLVASLSVMPEQLLSVVPVISYVTWRVTWATLGTQLYQEQLDKVGRQTRFVVKGIRGKIQKEALEKICRKNSFAGQTIKAMLDYEPHQKQ